MSNNNRNDNSKPNYIYPQPYIDPMVYLNPYYSNATGYQYNSQGYVEYPNNTGYIDYSQFNDNQTNDSTDQNLTNNNLMNNNTDNAEEYTNIPYDEDFNIPSIPYFPQTNMPNSQQGMPNMILPNQQYQSLPPNMENQGVDNNLNQQVPQQQQPQSQQQQQQMQQIQQNQMQQPQMQQPSQNLNPQNMQNINYQNPNMMNPGMPYGVPMQPNMMGGYIPMPKPPMYPVGMFPNMYPEMPPNIMYYPNYPSYPFVNVSPGMPSVNMEEFDEEEM